ncbi:cytochrome c3 family protein [Neobacillus massiliamazoniensis]|uniref:Nitrate/TMAO reductase membrane-bound tetraheme cytochrome c subunit-like protein n=1 Tax=Neobacillus massiliamazoniensis TaxID=1499688 RepID=A0A0U1NTJ8_9BACI|nr:NapC/NirT family cytochrome c [Neobacillus massiliamazoniensis]CRK81391.1 nitrate/TMAO reductase membrane-bound tetraheme cytochrome c subunit-like protein [Neobacillus massiliamazoniensis]
MAIWGKKKTTEPESREERKAGPIRRLWQKFRNIDWKNPVNRWKLLFVSLIGCIVIFGGGYGVLSLTNSPAFCSICHEMQPEHTSYTASSHNEISCVQCHVKPGMVNMVTHKVKSLKEVYYHVTGVPNQIVQTEEEAISNQNCLQCHSKNRLVTASGDLIVNHKGHINDGIPCITCHSGVVHAKMGAREINVAADRSKWTPENAQKLMEEKYLKPNMGTCIDCHDKVNKGEKPWKDVAYSVPPNPEEKKADTEKVKSSEGTDAAQAAHNKNTQDIILQAVGKQQKDVKVSMACETCHREIKVPKSHKIDDWKTNHGATAIQSLDTCMNCHQDSKWEKEIPKEDITTILKLGPQNSKYTPNVTVTKEEARTNKFCSACHSKRPPGHEQSNDWLTGHSVKASTPEAKAECFVCHDNAKPSPNSTDAKAPTDVYCQYCHRTGFKSDTKN